MGVRIKEGNTGGGDLGAEMISMKRATLNERERVHPKF